MRTKAILASSFLVALMVVPASVQADVLNIVNGGFETGSYADSSFTPIAGWTDAGTAPGFWLGQDNSSTGLDAAYPQDGALYLTAAVRWAVPPPSRLMPR